MYVTKLGTAPASSWRYLFEMKFCVFLQRAVYFHIEFIRNPWPFTTQLTLFKDHVWISVFYFDFEMD